MSDNVPFMEPHITQNVVFYGNASDCFTVKQRSHYTRGDKQRRCYYIGPLEYGLLPLYIVDDFGTLVRVTMR